MTDHFQANTPPTTLSHTVASFARDLNLEVTIQRAISFHPGLKPKLWLVPVTWSFRLKNTAGLAHYPGGSAQAYRIDLHPDLPAKGQLAETFLHELAHIMAHIIYGPGQNHGLRWIQMMFQLGQEPRRCHSMALQRQTKEIATSLEDLLDGDETL